jgi:hypothetical protein
VTTVEPGQIWKSADKRESRHVRVVSVGIRYAEVITVAADGLTLPGARRTRILIDSKGRLNRYRPAGDPS